MEMSNHHTNNTTLPPTFNTTVGGMHRHKMMMHMTFFWGTHTEVLFSGWPGSSPSMYVLALLFVFVLAILVEYLSHSRLIKDGSDRVVAGLIQTCFHAVRVGLGYMAMLAVMSFNGGVFLAVVLGHSVGFLLFGSRLLRKPGSEDQRSEMKC